VNVRFGEERSDELGRPAADNVAVRA